MHNAKRQNLIDRRHKRNACASGEVSIVPIEGKGTISDKELGERLASTKKEWKKCPKKTIIMLLEEEIEKALSLKEEPKSSLLMIDLVILARSKNISNKKIKATLRHLFIKYYEEGENNNDESRDKADKIADLLDAIEYDRV